MPSYTSNKRTPRPFFTTIQTQRLPLGFAARGQIGHLRIFRVRRGNGYFGARLNERYQDQYAYFVPASINNPEGQAARNALTQANWNWFNTLTAADRADYNKRAARKKGLYGRVLYIGEYVKSHA